MKKQYHWLAFFVLMMLGGEVVAATCTSIASGNWNNTSVWSCGAVPGAGDAVIITSPYTVSLNNASRSAASLTIDAGGTLDDNGRNLTVSGNVVINGTYDGGGNNGDLLMTGDGTTLSGTGTIIDIGHIYIDADVTIPAGSNLNLTQDAEIRVGDNAAATLTINGTITGTSQNSGNRILRLDNNNTSNVILNGTINAPSSYVEIQAGGTFTNNGTATLRHLDGDGAATATWTQGVNSSLTLSQLTQSWSGTFNASAVGNTVTWNAPATPLTPSSNTYYNLAGSGVTCPHGFTVLGSNPCGATVTSINRADANPTSAASVNWTVTFSTSVTGVDATDFALAASGVSGASITSVTGSGTTWTVTVSTGTGGGTLGLNLVDDDTIVDGGGLKLGGTGAGNGNFTGEVYNIRVVSGVVNTYYPGSTASVTAGATSITLGAAIGSTTPISIGDTLLIMQMQDASFDITNTDAYGDGVGSDLIGRGTTGVGGSGLYEYAIAASNVPISGGTLTLACGTTNAYTNAAATGTSGQKKYQVIRVPSYTSATLTSTLTASAWNGSAGGVLAFDVTGALTLGSATVSVNGLGFRGGATTTQTSGSGSNTDFRTLVSNNANGGKGEGIAGTPRYVFTAPSTRTDTGAEGYPNGSRARGAPGNAGGGATDRNPASNDQNPGGGGGGNGGAGGIGGIGWCSSFTTTAPYYGCGLSGLFVAGINPNGSTGGFGGAAVSGLGATRLTLGGGGGGGTANNITGSGACATVNGLCSSGVAGGGIIMIRAGSMTGSATFNANGSAGDDTVGNDGSGGGGAGGAVLISAGSGMGGVTINVAGGKGGNNLVSMSSDPHGPGGGGGGGYAITTSATASCSASGGANGVTYRNGSLFGAYGAMSGGSGSCTTGLTAAQIPGTVLGASACGATVDHYLISHSGTGLTCEAEPVTFTAHDSGHARVDANGKTLSITTNTSSGTWLTSADSCSQTCYNTSGTAAACAGSFTGTSGNNGQASYVFASGESGIRLCLKQNSAVSQNINVSDGAASEATGTAGAEGGTGADPNLVFGDTGIRIYADGSVDAIGNQIAGVRNDDGANHPATQTLTVRALKSGETTPARCVPLLTNVTRTLQFAYRCESSPSTCSASLPQGLEVNGTAVTGFDAASTPVPNDNVSVSFDANGHGSINLKYFDVGNISVWARATSLADSTTGSTFAVVAGNSNTFAVKPYDFEVIPCAASVVGACTVAPADPGLAGGGSVFAKAGETFKTTVTARALGGSKTYSFGRCDNSGGTGCVAAGEVVTLSQMLAAPGGGSSGTLGGTTTPAASAFVTNAGSYTFTDLDWSEAGVITLKATNADYLSNGLGSCTTQTAGEACQGTFGISGNLGRFIPDHFDIVLVSASGVPMTCPTGLTCPTNLLGQSGFAYSGQPFSVQVTARNAAGGTTQNYQGAYARAVTLSAWDALGSIVTQNPGSGAVGNGTITAATFASGVAVTATPTYTFGTVPTAPTDVYVRATDTDSVSSRRASSPGASVEPGLKVVNGRIRVGNAHGSEALPLPMTAKVEYYNGSYWTTSVTDSVTSLTLAATYNVVNKLGATTGTTTPTPTGAASVTNGVLNFTLSKPTGGTGSATINPTPSAWLPLTSGLATFGVYKGSNGFIYLRESY